MRYLIGNWKCNMNPGEIASWAQTLLMPDKKNLCVVVCPAYPFLMYTNGQVSAHSLNLSLGVQDVSAYPLGSYTGAVSCNMVVDYATYALVGHSERRQYFHETNEDIAQKVDQCLDIGITPVVCVDEPYAFEQLSMLDEAAYSQIIIAYEPLAAIGSGAADSSEHIAEVAARIGDMVDQKSPVLYGGSVSPHNASELAQVDGIQGFLVGGASLKADSFAAIATEM